MKLKNLVILPLLALLVSCDTGEPAWAQEGNKGTTLPFGKEVIVQLKREVSGVSAPVLAESDSFNPATTAISGRLMGISESWLELQMTVSSTAGATTPAMARSYWVPMESVLFLRAVELTQAK